MSVLITSSEAKIGKLRTASSVPKFSYTVWIQSSSSSKDGRGFGKVTSSPSLPLGRYAVSHIFEPRALQRFLPPGLRLAIERGSKPRCLSVGRPMMLKMQATYALCIQHAIMQTTFREASKAHLT